MKLEDLNENIFAFKRQMYDENKDDLANLCNLMLDILNLKELKERKEQKNERENDEIK